jgi:hypothetical protein
MIFRALKILIIGLALTSATWAKGKGAAKAIIVKGTVLALIKGKAIPVKRGDWLPEGAQIKTEPKSFTKLLFIDKSTMNVGPDSQMKIDSFPKNEAGIITLIKGQVRSKVTKNYMNIQDKEKSKLFIKTKTAAMGVRGTDFQVSFNTVNQSTSLITFEGAVAMAKLENNIAKGRPNQNALERVVSSQSAVVVRRGQYSGTSPETKRVTIPIKISPVQLETLEKNETPGMDQVVDQGSAPKQEKPQKKFRNIVPAGMDSKTLANDSNSADKMMGETVGQVAFKVMETQVKEDMARDDTGAPPPEGSIDMATGAIAPTAGGYVDINTAQYIPPPPGSSFDANAGVYVPPPEMGGIDTATGAYKNDFYDLNPDGTFTEKVQEPIDGAAPAPDGDRKIASVDGNEGGDKLGEAPPPPPDATLMPTMNTNLDQGLMDSAMTDGSYKAPPPPPGDIMMDYADQALQDNEQSITDFNNSDNNLIFGEGSTTVNFDVTVQ